MGDLSTGLVVTVSAEVNSGNYKGRDLVTVPQ